jgi:hypothetical protein
MIYTFQSGIQTAKFMIDKDKNMKIATERTRYRMIPLKLVFKQDKIKELNEKIKDMTEEQFDGYIISEFSRMGYSLKTKDADN